VNEKVGHEDCRLSFLISNRLVLNISVLKSSMRTNISIRKIQKMSFYNYEMCALCSLELLFIFIFEGSICDLLIVRFPEKREDWRAQEIVKARSH